MSVFHENDWWEWPNFSLLNTPVFILCCVGWRFRTRRVIRYVSDAIKLLWFMALYAIYTRSRTASEMHSITPLEYWMPEEFSVNIILIYYLVSIYLDRYKITTCINYIYYRSYIFRILTMINYNNKKIRTCLLQ